MYETKAGHLARSWQDTISEKSFYPWVVWGLAAGFFFWEYVVRMAPSAMLPELAGHLRLHAASLGGVCAAFYYAYVFMQIPVGALVDRFSPRKLLCFSTSLCCFGNYLFTITHSVVVALFARLLSGFASSFAFVVALKLATLWFPPSQLGLLAALTQVLGMLGAAFGEHYVALGTDMMGWQTTLHSITIAMLIISVATYFLVFDKPNSVGSGSKQDLVEGSKKLWRDLLQVVQSSQSWLNGMYAGLIFMPMTIFELWGVEYFKYAHNISSIQAADASSMLFIGWSMGGVLAGAISDRIQKRVPILRVSAFASLAGCLVMMYLPLPLWGLKIACFVYGFVNTGLVCAYAISAEQHPQELTGVSMAFANMMSVLVGAVFQPVVGWLLDAYWAGDLSADGIRLYSAEAYQQAMILMPVLLVLSIILSFMIKETYKVNPNRPVGH
ncbi:MAG: MFS transporter [Pseudomonadota bacterium]|nr:MFS transporter [Pseudomonadota bacterium]